MNLKLIVLFTILTLVVLVLIRIVIYNRYISRIKTKNIERFTSNNNSQVEQSVLDNIIQYPRLVFTSIMGETYFINGDDVIVVEDNKKMHVKLNKLFNIKKTIKVDGGYFNYLNGTVNMFENGMVHVYSYKESRIIYTKKIEDHLNLHLLKSKDQLNVDKINTVLVYFNKILVFYDTDSIIEIVNNDINKKSYTDYFPGLPSKISCAFINFLDVIKGIPLGAPTFIKNKQVYIYDLKDTTVKGPRALDDGLLNNVNVIKLVDTSTNMKTKTKTKMQVKESATYRMYVFGAGQPKGGYGGFVFNDLTLKKKDIINILSGLGGERLPVKGKESVNTLNEVYSVKLPYNSSSSGSGGTYVAVNNSLEIAAGGGGGWSNEIVEAPDFCHSQKFNFSNNITPPNPKNIIPITHRV